MPKNQQNRSKNCRDFYLAVLESGCHKEWMIEVAKVWLDYFQSNSDFFQFQVHRSWLVRNNNNFVLTSYLLFALRQKTRFYVWLDTSWTICVTNINNTSYEILTTQLSFWVGGRRAWHHQRVTTPTSCKKWLFRKILFFWKVIEKFISFFFHII